MPQRMRDFTLACLLFQFSSLSSPGLQTSDAQYARVRLRFETPIVADMKAGADVRLTVAGPPDQHPSTLLEPGRPARATVISVSRVAERTSVTVRFHEVQLADGSWAPLRPSPTGHALRYTSAQPVLMPAGSLAELEFRLPRAIPRSPAGSAAPAVPPVPSGLVSGDAVVLEDGTPIRLRLMRTLSSADAQIDERVDFEVLDEVRVGGQVVIERGATAWGTITEAQKKRRMGRAGKLAVSLDSVRLVTGDRAPLSAFKGSQGGGHVGKVTGAVVGTALVFWPAAPLFLLIHGKDTTIPKGTEVTAYIAGNITIRLPRKAQAETASGAPSSQAPQESLGRVEIVSEPSGAEIELDGAFVGSTPSTLELPVGDHEISIKKQGYVPWTRKVRIHRGTSTLSATLEKLP